MHIPSRIVTRYAQDLRRAAHLIEDARSVEDLDRAMTHTLNLWSELRTLAEESSRIDSGLARTLRESARGVLKGNSSKGRIAPCDKTLMHLAALNRQTATLMYELSAS